ncbi:dentin sialophosphoprotein-like isoform X4 [Astyanax mexicanus]|uniref:dentin sialophosphoprotein-like isoform X4 n=1 Tax=Astyanax mexicanus TaxID=7994 RepID=UPI0020CB66E7|nr:dentin sialophosphoprotein-like isoform X4 [Astyanax mexicanus]
MGRSAQSCEVMVMVMVVVMLVCGWTDGKVVSKCDLRSRLQKAFLRHPSDVIAKMVCTVEYISVFNTGLVTTNNNGPLGSFIGPQYNKGYNYPIPEVIGDYFPENWPGTAEPENPSFPPEVVSDDLIPARPSQKPAVTSVQSGEEQGSGDEPPSGNGSGKGSKSQTGGKHGVDSGEESGEDGSGESLKSKSKGKREVDSGEGLGEDGSGYHFSGEGSGSSGEPLEATTAIPLLGITNQEIIYDSYEDLFGHKQREDSGESSKSKSKGKGEADSGEESGEDGSGYHFSEEGSGSSGEPLEPTTAIPEGDSTNNDFFPGDTDEIPAWQRKYPYEPRNNEDIHYDSYETIYGHPQKKDPNMPNNHEGRPYTYYNHGNPYNGNHQDSSPRNLYGIFQLSDNMACQSQGRHSLNACSLYCEDLIDSDITDDIDCLMTLKNLGMDVMVLEQCQTIGASEYFAECD